MYHSFLIHSSADGHLGCFHVLAIINSAAMNIGYTCLFPLWFPQCVCPAVGLLDHKAILWSNRCRQFGSPAFSKTSLNIWKFTVHVLLKPDLKNFEQYFTSVWDECNCAVAWAFFGIAFLWDWNENVFPVLWPLLRFLNLLAYWVQHFHSIIFQNFK